MMTQQEPLLSNDWYRIAHLKPRLRAGVRISHQWVRGKLWFVLSDPVSGRHLRFNEQAFSLISACNGDTTIDDLWAKRVDIDGDDAMTQGAATRVVSQAFSANLLVGNLTPDAAAIVNNQVQLEKRRRFGSLNPLAVRLPLLDPDKFLSAHLVRLLWLFNPVFKGLLGTVICLGLLLFAFNADEISAYAHQELGSGRMLLMMWIAYPIIKAFHELAHAVAIKYYGGEVHEMGLTLLMLTPVPYVDASASVAFSDKRQRIEVAAAGIIVEVFLASLALSLWLLLEPGLAKDLSFAVVFVGAISTLAINANPLLRFDGYFVLCDAVEMPNLANRSTQFWLFLIKQYGLRLPQTAFQRPGAGELPWLLAYGPLSWMYRVVLIVSISIIVGNISSLLGALILLTGAWMTVLKPLVAIVRWTIRSGELREHRPRAALLTVLVLTGGLTMLIALPIPDRTYASGVVWLPDDAMVRLDSDGFVERFFVRDGDRVQAGDLIAQVRNEPLQVSLNETLAQLEQLKTERARAFDSQALESVIMSEQLNSLMARHDRLQSQVDALKIRSKVAGRVTIDPRQVIPGQYLAQGELIALVMPGDAPMVRTMIRNDKIALVQDKPEKIEVYLAGRDAAPVNGQLAGTVPEASNQLPTAALGQSAGGSIAVDSSDSSGLTAREAFYQLDVQLEQTVHAQIGARALVTISHGQTNAASLASRFLRRSLLGQLDS